MLLALTCSFYLLRLLSYYSRDRATDIRCLRLPLGADEDLLDSEYADDTSLFVEDSEETFESV